MDCMRQQLGEDWAGQLVSARGGSKASGSLAVAITSWDSIGLTAQGEGRVIRSPRKRSR